MVLIRTVGGFARIAIQAACVTQCTGVDFAGALFAPDIACTLNSCAVLTKTKRGATTTEPQFLSGVHTFVSSGKTVHRASLQRTRAGLYGVGGTLLEV